MKTGCLPCTRSKRPHHWLSLYFWFSTVKIDGDWRTTFTSFGIWLSLGPTSHLFESIVFFKGGNGYDLSKHILTPIAEPANDGEARFNEAHAKILSIAQMTIEDLQRRFECLLQLGFAPEGSLDKKCNIIKSCCVLHNIAKKFSVPPPPHNDKVPVCHFPGKVRLTQVEVNPEALKARQEIINSHFSENLHRVEEPPVGETEEEEEEMEKEHKESWASVLLGRLPTELKTAVVKRTKHKTLEVNPRSWRPRGLQLLIHRLALPCLTCQP